MTLRPATAQERPAAGAGGASPSAGQLDDAELRASLERMGLLRPGEACRLAPLAGGVSSRIVKVETAGLRLCFKQALAKLNVTASWYAPVERSRAEVRWMRAAASILPGIAPKVLGEDPERYAFAMDYLDPAAWPLWKAELQAGRVNPAAAQATGAALVAIHAATAGRPGVEAAFNNTEQFAALRIEPYLLATAQAHPDLAAELRRIAARTGNQRRALVHGDVSPKNILLGGAQGVVLLDSETATYGDPAFDLAFCLNHLLLKAISRPQDAARLGRSIASLLDAYRAGVNWEAWSGLEARATDLTASLMLARIDGKSPVEYLGEPARERVRSFARGWLASPRRTLQTLWMAWMTEVEG